MNVATNYLSLKSPGVLFPAACRWVKFLIITDYGETIFAIEFCMAFTYMQDFTFYILHSTFDANIRQFPGLFPAVISAGYRTKDIKESKKLSIPIRRIKVSGVSYTIRPSFVMPYMTGFVKDVEKALFLRKFDVSFCALSYVFRKNPITAWLAQQ